MAGIALRGARRAEKRTVRRSGSVGDDAGPWVCGGCWANAAGQTAEAALAEKRMIAARAQPRNLQRPAGLPAVHRISGPKVTPLRNPGKRSYFCAPAGKVRCRGLRPRDVPIIRARGGGADVTFVRWRYLRYRENPRWECARENEVLAGGLPGRGHTRRRRQGTTRGVDSYSSGFRPGE